MAVCLRWANWAPEGGSFRAVLAPPAAGPCCGGAHGPQQRCARVQFVGDLRRYMAEAFGAQQDAQIRLLSMGFHCEDDAMPLANLSTQFGDRLTINVMLTKANLLHVSAQPEDVQARVLQTAPNTLLFDDAPLRHMLLYLLDQPPGRIGVHCHAYQVRRRNVSFLFSGAALPARPAAGPHRRALPRLPGAPPKQLFIALRPLPLSLIHI